MIRFTAALFCFYLTLTGQETIDHQVNARIRREAIENSKILRTIHYLTDVFGARVTGSPAQRAASEWAARQLTEWGLSNARLEPWNIGLDGWSNQRVAAFLTSPVEDTLVAEALAWTPGTDGTVAAPCVQLVPPDDPTQEELSAWLAGKTESVRGKIVLAGKHTVIPASVASRMETRLFWQPNGPAPANPVIEPADPAPALTQPVRLTPQQVSAQVDRFLQENGALVRVNDSAQPMGQVRVTQNSAYDVTRVRPTLVLRNEDFGRISRLLEGGLPVEMEVQIASRTHPEGRVVHNVLAEIPGTDKRDELVMLGGHIDSLPAATGATDNASGVAVMMEAARILKAIGVEPRRTIRVALWSGEEQGLRGSSLYVSRNFGSAETPRLDFARLSAYFNQDYGTGRIRGLAVFGPPAAAEVLQQILSPFAGEGGLEATATRSRQLGGSDHSPFWRAGLPGISLLQEPWDYIDTTWHTNLDTYERIREEDLKQNAIMVASAIYHLAVRDQILPRFAAWEMPRIP